MKYFRQFVMAKSAAEAVALRKAVGPASLYIAGGTTVVPMASKTVQVLVDISHLGLDGIDSKDDTMSIGATTKISDLISEETLSAVPLLHKAARHCATPIIRNMATVGGSLAGAYLPSDLAVALIALGADLEIMGDEERTVSIVQLIGGGWLSAYDLVSKVHVSKLKSNQGTGFAKFGRSGIDIALVNVATLIEVSDRVKIESLKISVGQSSSMPVLLEDIAEQASGETISLESIKKLARSASSLMKPRSDFRASPQYRKRIVEVLVARSLFEAAKEVGSRFED